jgi:hypothetical protein
MANNTFEFIGRLSVGKESEKFKPFEEKISAKGWKTTTLKHNVTAGDNRHFLEVKGGHWADGHGEIFSFTKGEVDASGNRVKGVSIKFPFKDRLKQENIDKVAEFKKHVIDLEEYGFRYKIKNALEKIESEDLTLEDVEALKVETFVNTEAINKKILELKEKISKTKVEKEIQAFTKMISNLESQLKIKDLTIDTDIKTKKTILTLMLDVSNKKRKEFLSEQDYAEYLYKLITKGNINDKMFIVKGEKVYSEYNGKNYESLVPNRIYLAEKDAKPMSTGQFEVFFNKESLDENSFEETKKYYINGYVRNYDNNRKAEIPCPIQLVIDCSKDEENEKAKKLHKLLKSQFVVEDDSWKEIGVKVNLLDGSQKVEITEDMLTDFQKEMLELDPDFMDEIRKELKGDLYGEKVKETVILNVSKGYSKGRKDTFFIDEDFIVKTIELKEKDTTDNNTKDEEDIFDTEDDLDLDI